MCEGFGYFCAFVDSQPAGFCDFFFFLVVKDLATLVVGFSSLFFIFIFFNFIRKILCVVKQVFFIAGSHFEGEGQVAKFIEHTTVVSVRHSVAGRV